MKKITLLLVILAFMINVSQAQKVPQGMRYQAIARDLDGSILEGQNLTVKIDLITIDRSEQVYYSETQVVQSNNFGLLNLTIGEGKPNLGKFEDIPWSSQNIWARISVKMDNEPDFSVVSVNKMYSVPYAFHAETATRLASDDEERILKDNEEKGMNSINWTLEGNRDAEERNDGNPVLGTVDETPLVIVTNCIPRLTISADGDISIPGDFLIEGDLTVEGTTTVEDLEINGSAEFAEGGIVPCGGIIMWSGSIASIPTGWALCDGSSMTPDLRDRFIVGAGNTYDPGDTGGANSVALTVAEMPSHDHSGITSSDGDHDHTGTISDAGIHSHIGSTTFEGLHSHTGSTSVEGEHTHSGETYFDGSHIHNLPSGILTGNPLNIAFVTSLTPTPGHVQAFNMPRTSENGGHTHLFDTDPSGNHDHGVYLDEAGEHNHEVETENAGEHSHTLEIDYNGSHNHTISSQGGNSAHENRPPYYALAFIMKVCS